MPLPAAVANIQRHVRSPAYRTSRSKRVLAAIDRLVSRPDVFPVWEGIPRARGLPAPLDFLAACEGAIAAWERMPRLPDGEIKKNLKRTAAEARALADMIDRQVGEIDFFGIPLFVANHLASLSDERRDPHGRHRLPFLFDPSKAIGRASIQSLLRELAVRLEEPSGKRVPHSPRKIRAKDAERTFLVKTLVDFFRRNGGEPLWEWVALSVAALMDGDPLDVRHVQLLAEDIHPMFTDPGAELLWYSQFWDAEHDPDHGV